jgi:hypothetical protein
LSENFLYPLHYCNKMFWQKIQRLFK